MKHKSILLLMLAGMLVLSACQDKNNEGGQTVPSEEVNEEQVEETPVNEETEPETNDEVEPPASVDPAEENDETEGATQAPDNQASETGSDDQPPASGSEQTVEATLYFADQQLLQTYRVAAQIPAGTPAEQLQAALDLWAAGPKEETLQSLLPKGTTINYVKEEDGVVYLDFSAEITGANLGSSAESFIIDQIATMAAQFGYSKTQILVGGEQVESLLGHMYIAEPVEPLDPENFPWYSAS